MAVIIAYKKASRSGSNRILFDMTIVSIDVLFGLMYVSLHVLSAYCGQLRQLRAWLLALGLHAKRTIKSRIVYSSIPTDSNCSERLRQLSVVLNVTSI